MSAKEKANLRDGGVWKAELPTGSGKTLLSLRYGLHHDAHFRKKRLVYVTAFLSVLEQNAKAWREFLSEPSDFLEHHSNALNEDSFESFSDASKEKNSLADAEDGNIEEIRIHRFQENWDVPIIATTMVQFFNTLFGPSTPQLRRFAHLIHSTIMIDEVQSLPTKAISCFNGMVAFLATVMNASVVFLTATEPELQSTQLPHPIQTEDKKIATLVEIRPEERPIFDRVTGQSLSENVSEAMTRDALAERIAAHKSDASHMLIILNTKKAVMNLYRELREKYPDEEIYYLTTNLCARHRQHKIEEIRQKLKNKFIIVVSTQLMEAGVDLDFHYVYRSLAGIDSLIQAMGRCNRYGLLKKGYFFYFDYSDEEDLSRLPDIKDARRWTIWAMQNKRDASIFDLKKSYFDKKYANSNELDYPIKICNNMTTIWSLLSDNKVMRGSFRDKHQGKECPPLVQQFETAAKSFRLIDEVQRSVVVPYGEAEQILQSLAEHEKRKEWGKVKSELRRLSPYTIQLSSRQDISPYCDSILDGNLSVLLPAYYDQEIGLNTEKLETIIF